MNGGRLPVGLLIPEAAAARLECCCTRLVPAIARAARPEPKTFPSGGLDGDEPSSLFQPLLSPLRGGSPGK